jgi:hypothetical protein
MRTISLIAILSNFLPWVFILLLKYKIRGLDQVLSFWVFGVIPVLNILVIAWLSNFPELWHSKVWSKQPKTERKASYKQKYVQTSSIKVWLTLFFKRKALELSFYFKRKALDEQSKIDGLNQQRGNNLEDWADEFKKWCSEVNPSLANEAIPLSYLWDRYKTDFFAAQKANKGIPKIEGACFSSPQ